MVVDSRILQLTLLSESLSRRDIANTVERERKDGRRVKSGQQRGNETGLSEVGLDGLESQSGTTQRHVLLQNGWVTATVKQLWTLYVREFPIPSSDFFAFSPSSGPRYNPLTS